MSQYSEDTPRHAKDHIAQKPTSRYVLIAIYIAIALTIGYYLLEPTV